MPSSSTLSRRAFVASLPAAVAAVSGCRLNPYRASDFTVPARSVVGLYPAASYDVDLADVIFRGLTDLGMHEAVRGRNLFLKPNIVEYEQDTAINTHPRMVAGAIQALLKAGAAGIVVGEGPGHRRDVEYLLVSTGLYDHLREMRIRFVDLNHDDVERVRLASDFTGLHHVALPRALLRADMVVSMPKLKTHHWAGITAGMKNFFGALPGSVYGWPKNILHLHGIDASILDLNATIKPGLTIVDAVTAMEGDGPIMGRPRPMGFVAISRDVVAADSTCARIMGIEPEKVPYLKVGGHYLGNASTGRIDVRGERLARYQTRFELPQLLTHIAIGA